MKNPLTMSTTSFSTSITYGYVGESYGPDEKYSGFSPDTPFSILNWVYDRLSVIEISEGFMATYITDEKLDIGTLAYVCKLITDRNGKNIVSSDGLFKP
jgi:hypothetical protein